MLETKKIDWKHKKNRLETKKYIANKVMSWSVVRKIKLALDRVGPFFTYLVLVRIGP